MSLVADHAKAFEKVQLVVVLQWTIMFDFHKKDSESALWAFYTPKTRKIRDTISKPLLIVTAIILFLRIVMQEDMTKVFDVFPETRTRVYVHDINYIFRKQNMFLTHTQSRAH